MSSPSSSSSSLSPSRFYRLKSIITHSTVARYALFSSCLQFIVQLILEIGVAITHISDFTTLKPILDAPLFKTIPPDLRDSLINQYNLSTAITVYHVIYMFANMMQLYITVDSILHQNSIELIALNVINSGLFGYSIIQLFQSNDIFTQINLTLKQLPGNLLSIIPLDNGVLHVSTFFYYPAIVVSLVFFLGTLVFSYKLHQEYGWAIYKRIGADISLRRQMMHFFFLMMLLKLDVFFYSTFSLQFLIVGITSKELSTGELILHLVVAVAMILVLILLCVKGIREEKNNLMYIFMAGTIACIGYLSWKLNQAFTKPRFEPVRKSITFSIVACLILGIITLISSIICYRNFGMGLKTHVGPEASARRREERERAYQAELGNINNNHNNTNNTMTTSPQLSSGYSHNNHNNNVIKEQPSELY